MDIFDVLLNLHGGCFCVCLIIHFSSFPSHESSRIIGYNEEARTASKCW